MRTNYTWVKQLVHLAHYCLPEPVAAFQDFSHGSFSELPEDVRDLTWVPLHVKNVLQSCSIVMVVNQENNS